MKNFSKIIGVVKYDSGGILMIWGQINLQLQIKDIFSLFGFNENLVFVVLHLSWDPYFNFYIESVF